MPNLSAVLFLTLMLKSSSGSSAVQIEVTTPINPVRVGDMFCLHCQVWNKDSDHELTIYRIMKDDGIDRIVWDGELLQSVEDRFFLATRIMDDGSIVYFLSVTNVNKNDKGAYTCGIMEQKGPDVRTVQSDTASVTIQYFPPEIPMCSTNALDLNRVYSGTEITFTCTSQKGEPAVDIRWTREGKKIKGIKPGEGHGNTIQLDATVRLGMADQGAIFVCEIHSPVFPDEINTCHIGPITVLTSKDEDSNQYPIEKTTRSNGDIQPGIPVTKAVDINSGQALKCGRLCAQIEDSKLLLWRISTAVAFGLALLFLLMGITIACKISNINSSNIRMMPSGEEGGDSRPMYEDLLRRRVDDQVYMSIDKANIDKHGVAVAEDKQGVFVAEDIGHYHTAQDIPNAMNTPRY